MQSNFVSNLTIDFRAVSIIIVFKIKKHKNDVKKGWHINGFQ